MIVKVIVQNSRRRLDAPGPRASIVRVATEEAAATGEGHVLEVVGVPAEVVRRLETGAVYGLVMLDSQNEPIALPGAVEPELVPDRSVELREAFSDAVNMAVSGRIGILEKTIDDQAQRLDTVLSALAEARAEAEVRKPEVEAPSVAKLGDELIGTDEALE